MSDSYVKIYPLCFRPIYWEENGTKTPVYSNVPISEKKGYISSGYWTDNEEDALWYGYLNFNYVTTNLLSIYKISVVVIALRAINIDILEILEGEKGFFEAIKRHKAIANFEGHKIYDCHTLLLNFINEYGDKDKLDFINKKIDFCKNINKNRRSPRSPIELRYSLGNEYQRQMTMVTDRQLKNMFAITADIKKLLAGHERLVVKNECYYMLNGALNLLIENNFIPRHYFLKCNYESADLSMAVFHYFFEKVRDLVWGNTTLNDHECPWRLSEIHLQKNITIEEVIYAAEREYIKLYLRGSDLTYENYSNSECAFVTDNHFVLDLFSNERYGKIHALRLGGDNYLEKYKPGLNGLTVSMIRDQDKVTLNYDEHNRGKVHLLPTKVEKDYGITPILLVKKSVLEKFMEHVLVLPSEWEEYKNRPADSNTAQTIRKKEATAKLKKIISHLKDKNINTESLQFPSKCLIDYLGLDIKSDHFRAAYCKPLGVKFARGTSGKEMKFEDIMEDCPKL